MESNIYVFLIPLLFYIESSQIHKDGNHLSETESLKSRHSQAPPIGDISLVCIQCQRQDSRADNQIPARLPSDRISRSYPFPVIGGDHASPVDCQDSGAKKLYILLRTCGVTRAVHLGLLPSLSLTDFLKAFRNFVARRRLLSDIYSDNDQTFQSAGGLVR